MAIAYRSSGTFTAADSTGFTLIDLPAGLANGDLLILPVQTRGGGTVNTPSGYTRAAQVNITKGHRLAVFYKYVTNAAGEVAPTVTQSASGLICARPSAFSGVHATTQLDVAAVTNKHTDLATVTAKTINPITQSTMVLWVFSTADNNTLTSNSQGTLAYSSDTTTGVDGSLALVYELQPATVAAAGTCTMTQSANGPDNWNTITLALRPSATADVDPATDLFDGIDYDVDIAFGATPLTPDPVWTRVTADMLEAPVTIEAGRNGEFSPSAPGTMVGVTLANADRKYDPENTAGPYFGQLNPFTRIRIWVRHLSVNYPMFTGYIKSWPQSYIGNLYSWVTLEAVDLFTILTRFAAPETALTLAVLGDDPHAYFPMFEESGRVCSDRSGNGWSASYGASVQFPDSFVPGEPQAKAKQVYAFGSNIDFTLFGATGPTVDLVRSIEVWISVVAAIPSSAGTGLVAGIYAGSTNNFFIIQAEITGLADGGDALTIESSVQDITFTVTTSIGAFLSYSSAHHVVATLDSTGTTHSLYVDGQLVATENVSARTFEGGAGSTGVTTEIGESVDVYMAHAATYEETLTAAQVLEHYEAGVTGGMLETGEDRMERLADFVGLIAADLYDGTAMGADTYLGHFEGGGTILDAMQTTMVAEQGRLYVDGTGVLVAQGRAADWGVRLPVNVASQATFGDDALTELPYATFELEPASVDLCRNVIEVNIGDGNALIQDDDSVVLLGPQPDSISTQLSSVADALNLGRSRLRRYADPTTRVSSMTVDLRDPRLIADGGVPILLAMQLGWRITVIRRPQGTGTPIEKEMTVEGITRRVGDGTFTMTLYLVPAHTAYTEHPWFIVGDATYGLIGTAAGNKVPR